MVDVLSALPIFFLISLFSAVHYYGSMLFMEVIPVWVPRVVCCMRESWLFCLYKSVCLVFGFVWGWFFFFQIKISPTAKRDVGIQT